MLTVKQSEKCVQESLRENVMTASIRGFAAAAVQLLLSLEQGIIFIQMEPVGYEERR